jgi:NRAMP (natural resistance-associated macrophage protein)-like metal ion transporter
LHARTSYNQTLREAQFKVPKTKSIRPSTKLQKPSANFFRQILARLGPGLITGAADDDPSGIGTYSQVGAQFGYGMLWTVIFSYPLMSVIQEISARIGRVTGKGIAANIRRHYSKSVLYVIVSLLLIANVCNLGADIDAMGAVANLLLPGPTGLYVLVFGAISLLLQILVPYSRYVHYLKWLTLVLFAYVITSFVMREPKLAALHATFLPSISFHREYFTALIAVLGTTISPYLFFWQASEEVEEVTTHAIQKPLLVAPDQGTAQLKRIRFDTYFGMAVSNLVAFFVILTAAATLHVHGILDIQTASQAAKALEPLAGKFAFVIFALGIIGTGLLAVPVLAGSAAYGVSEAFGWTASLQKKPKQAVRFYSTIGVATCIGVALTFAHVNPMKALFWSAVINGIVAVPVMVIMMILTHNPKIMGKFTLPPYLRWVGWLATAVMFFASLGLFFASH